eukprot:Rhum_TRINITY_DN1418_c0_g2::Rhum_TRINITY_DN1418_c0_g2_i1::g.4158::m.4158
MGGGGSKSQAAASTGNGPPPRPEGTAWDPPAQQQPAAAGAAGADPPAPPPAAPAAINTADAPAPTATPAPAAAVAPSSTADGSPTPVGSLKVAVLGLDGAGKTRLAALAQGEERWSGASRGQAWSRCHVVTQGQALDLWVAGGGQPQRRHWGRVAAGAVAVVYVFSLEDPMLLPLAYSELLALLRVTPVARLLLLFHVTPSANPSHTSPAEAVAALMEAYGRPPAGLAWDVKELRGSTFEGLRSADAVLRWVAG